VHEISLSFVGVERFAAGTVANKSLRNDSFLLRSNAASSPGPRSMISPCKFRGAAVVPVVQILPSVFRQRAANRKVV
jgi:hypothetical protein